MSNNKIVIEHLVDEHDCETCGSSWAEGALITLPDSSTVELKPLANCFGGAHWDREEILLILLKKLGYEVTHNE